MLVGGAVQGGGEQREENKCSKFNSIINKIYFKKKGGNREEELALFSTKERYNCCLSMSSYASCN